LQGEANACLVWIWEDLLDNYVFQYCRFMVSETKKFMSLEEESRRKKTKVDRVWMAHVESKRKANTVAKIMQGVSALAVVGCSIAAFRFF
jgi:hypothetical protein